MTSLDPRILLQKRSSAKKC